MKLKKMNYFSFLSRWIENFGVVPLVSFATFLLFPIFFLLFALFVFVTRVLETITALLNQLLIFNNFKYLRPRASLVKAIFMLLLLSTSLMAQSGPQVIESIVLGIGEHREIQISKGEKFSIGSGVAVSHKRLSGSGILLLRGKGLGSAELWIRTKEHTRLVRVHVIEKRRLIGLRKIISRLEGESIRVNWKGQALHLDGVIKRYSDWKFLKSSNELYSDSLLIDLTLDKSLQSSILVSLYQKMFKEGDKHVQCQFKNIILECLIEKKNHFNKSLIKYFKDNFGVQFVVFQKDTPTLNYSIRIELFFLKEKTNNSSDFGLNEIHTSWEKVFNLGPRSLISNNQIKLINKKYNLQNSHTHQLLLQSGEVAKLKLSEQLALQIQLTANNEFIETKYSLNQGDKVSFKSKVLIRPDVKRELFSLLLDTNSNDKKSLPIIKHLFTGRTKEESKIRLWGWLKIEKRIP